MNPASDSTEEPRALIGWRLLSMMYDLLPVVAMWLLVSAIFTVAYTFLGNHAVRENIPPFSPLQWLLWAACWGACGLYAVLSWRRGGQTLGMRPWRLKVVSADGGAPTTVQLWKRYAVASLSTLLAGAGFWWAWFDRGRLTWHDRLSKTRTVRMPKPTH